MFGVRSMWWYMAVLAVATVISGSGKCALASDAFQTQFCGTLVQPYGYLCAEYRTYSADGYELLMHRVGSRPTERLDETLVSQTRETDTASLNCEDTEQLFSSQRCLQGQPSSRRNIPEPNKLSVRSGRQESAPGGIFRSPPAAAKSKTADRHASVPSPSPSVDLSKVEAISVSSPSPTHDQKPNKFLTGRVPVLVMHQEFLNGDSWFQLTDAADRLFPLLLVDAGFEVWIGHERATYWSHGHLHLQQDEQKYWNWTWDEHAKYDVPALLELIYDITGSAAHYVGISQSATVGAAAATMPESSRFMRSLTLIGPTIYVGFSSSVVLDEWAFIYGNNIDQNYLNEGFQHGAFNFSREFNVTSVAGRGPAGAELGAISGPNCCFGPTVVSFTNGWDGTTSYKNLIHYQQGVRTNFWRHFDFQDPYRNAQAYGKPYAPDYLPENIPSNIPVSVIYGGQDTYSSVGGIICLLSRLGTRSESALVPAYAHYDLFYSVYRSRDVFTPILHFLEEHRWN